MPREPMSDPYPETPGEREARLKEVRRRIRSAPEIPSRLAGELADRADEFVESAVYTSPTKPRFYGGQLGWTRWVIRNDHLDLVIALAPIASAVATYATATAASGANPITLAVTLTLAVAAVGTKLRAKSASLDLADYQVLMALKQIGPGSPQQVADALNGIRIYGPDMWTEERILCVLQRLKSVRLGDGSVEAFAVELPNGWWSANGV